MLKSGCKHRKEASEGWCYKFLAHDGKCLATVMYTVCKCINKLCMEHSAKSCAANWIVL